MRTFETVIGDIRRKVFLEIARLACEGGDYTALEELPYKIAPGEDAHHRSSIFLERAVIGERLRLAIGLPLRSMEEHAPLSMGIEASAIAEKYYEPPLVNIIKFACNACPTQFIVTDQCLNCLAHPCTEVCPVNAVSILEHKSFIDQQKCIQCGRCEQACPYHAIIHMQRPCALACGVDAIGNDEKGRAVIDYDKCVMCGMCIVNCPFGAISDKAQIFQMIHALKAGTTMIAIIAPSFVGQFGPKVKPGQLSAGLKELGFERVVEVAIGADLCAQEEARDFLDAVPAKQPFMTTSCCFSWITLTKRFFPQLSHNISMSLTPMVLTARLLKQDNPAAKIVFIGPCAAKKLEAMREDIRSEVDFVITFEELQSIFDAREIDLLSMPEDPDFNDASTQGGRGFPMSGGVAAAVKDVVGRLEPDRELKIATAENLRECVELLKKAGQGKYDGFLLEGMACPGGCVAGTGTIREARKTAILVDKYKGEAETANPADSIYTEKLSLLE